MKRKTAAWFWPLLAIVAVFGLGFVVAMSMVARPRPVVVEVTQKAGPSAAMTIITFLVLVILGLILAVAGGVFVMTWNKRRRRQAELEDAMYQAQAYALLQGAKPPAPTGGGLSPYAQQGSGPVIVVGGSPGPQYPPQAINLEDLARAAQGRPSPFSGYLPPSGGGWGVER